MDKDIKTYLLDTYRVNDCHLVWCRNLAYSDNPTEKQLKTARQLKKIAKHEQTDYVIFNDELIPAVTKHKKYQWNHIHNCWRTYKLIDGRWCLLDKYKADSK